MDELEQLLENFADAVEGAAFDIPPPNPHTPLLVSMAIHARMELRRIRAGRPSGDSTRYRGQLFPPDPQTL